jgi:hypothetical protein
LTNFSGEQAIRAIFRVSPVPATSECRDCPATARRDDEDGVHIL